MAAAARCRDRGMTPAAIARFLGVSREVVARYLRQWDRDHDREHQEDQ
jgi:predicted transcriptional regulator